MNINKQLDKLAERYDKGEFTDSQYLAEITKLVKAVTKGCNTHETGVRVPKKR